jgi:hypothetical protein
MGNFDPESGINVPDPQHRVKHALFDNRYGQKQSAQFFLVTTCAAPLIKFCIFVNAECFETLPAFKFIF